MVDKNSNESNQSANVQKRIGLKIRSLQIAANLSQEELANKVHLDRAVLSRIENGTRPIRDTELLDFSKVFDVSADYILGNTQKKHYYNLSKKENRDIGKEAQNIIDGIDTAADVNFYGEPMTDEQKQSMKEIIEMGLKINQEKAKKKFTPIKYRHGE